MNQWPSSSSSTVEFWQRLSPRRRKAVVWAVAAIVFYTIFGFLILPFIVKAVAVKQISKQLDREASISQVRINPYVLSAMVRGLMIKDKDGQPFISVDEAYANFQLSSLFGRAWVFKEVRTKRPYCRVQINPDYSFNFSDLAKKFAQSSPKRPSKPLYLHVDQLMIDGAAASFTDLTLSAPFQRTIGPVQISLTNFHTDPKNPNPYAFSGTTDSGERFSWSGNFSLDPLESSGDVSLKGLAINKYTPLFSDAVRFEIKDGVIEGRATYHFLLSGDNYSASLTNAAGSVKSLRVAPKGGSRDLIDLKEISMSGLSVDTAARTAEIKEIYVQGGEIAARRNRDETIDLVEMAGPSEKSTKAAPGGGVMLLMRTATNAFAALVNSTNLWSATLDQLTVTNCSVEWEDLANPRPVQLMIDDVSVSAEHLSNMAGKAQTAALSLRWNTNGTIGIKTSVQLSPPEADVTFALDRVELKPLDPYLESFLNLFLTDSKLGLQAALRMQVGTNGVAQAGLKGDARLDDFVTVDLETKELLKWKSVQFAGIDANLDPQTVAIKQIAILDPYARVAFDTNQTLNLVAVLKTPASNAPLPDTSLIPTGQLAAAPAKSGMGRKLGAMLRQALGGSTNSASSSVPKITIDSISISNGFVQFHDGSVQPPVAMTLQAIEGSIANVSTEELRRADLNLTAKADRTGPIEITGKINPLGKGAATELKVVFSDVNLTPASPYSAKFLGYKLDRGRLGLKVGYEVSERHLKADNVLTLDQFTFGEKVESPDATKMPVRLAIALLKDRQGKIELDVPIEGNLDDPSFHFGKVIIRVLVNIITKIATSPFAALGALLGGKGEEVSFQEFAPGAEQPTDASAEKLQVLINALYERPGLQLEIDGGFDPVGDRDAIRRQRLDQQFRQQKWSELSKTEQARIAPENVVLNDQTRNACLEKAYAAAVRANSNATNAAAGKAGGTRATTARSVEASGKNVGKGATALLNFAPAEPQMAVNEKEALVLSTIPVNDDELGALAEKRAKNIREKIIASGKVESERLSIVNSSQAASTNQTARVYFQLK